MATAAAISAGVILDMEFPVFSRTSGPNGALHFASEQDRIERNHAGLSQRSYRLIPVLA
jgi:hypothetical protein